MSFADVLKDERRKNSLTQEELADMLGVSRQAVSKWEQGEGYPEVEKLLVLADRLDISLDELMGRPNKNSAAAEDTAEEPLPEVVSYVPQTGEDPLNFDGEPERETPEAKRNRMLLAVAFVCIALIVVLFLSGLK